MDSVKASIDVRIDSQLGTVARLKLAETSDFNTVQAAIAQKLDGFLFSYELEEV